MDFQDDVSPSAMPSSTGLLAAQHYKPDSGIAISQGPFPSHCRFLHPGLAAGSPNTLEVHRRHLRD
jgi:hypothetical protein